MRSDFNTLPRPWMLVVAGGLVMGLALGVRHAQGIFLVPVTVDRGWSREAFGFAIALQNLVWGLAQPFTGMIADRFGAPPRQNSCRLDKILNSGAMMRETWRDTDRNSRIER